MAEPKRILPKTPETKEKHGFLVNKCYLGDAIKIGDDIEVHVTKTASSYATLAVRAPKTVRIRRQEKP